MKKNVHVHLHEQATPTRDADSGEGRWVTINGTHVQIKDGKITAGPKGTVGKGVQEGLGHLAHKTDKTFKKHKGHDREVPGGKAGSVHVHVRPGASVRGATAAHETQFHMSTGLAAHHAEKGDLMHYSETSEGKRDAHKKKAEEHRASAHEQNELGGKEAVGAHVHAARMHERAAAHHELRDPKAEEASAEAHKASEALSQGKHPKNADRPHVNTVKPMPAAHERLHGESREATKGSKKHAERHNELENQYHAANADWERNAINRQIERNAGDARQVNVDRLHKMATDASEAAHAGKISHHSASGHIENAIVAHGKHGGVGYAKKQDELRAMQKKHKEAWAAGPSESQGPSRAAHVREHHGMAEKHRDKAEALRGLNDLEAATNHERAASLHDKGPSSPEASKAAHEASAKLFGTPPPGAAPEKPKSKAQREREARARLDQKRRSGGFDAPKK